MITGELKNKIGNIWGIFWSSGMTNPLTAIEQLTYLMFIKILDDNKTRRRSNAALFGVDIENPVFDADHRGRRCERVGLSYLLILNARKRDLPC